MSAEDAWLEYLLRQTMARIEGEPITDAEAAALLGWGEAQGLADEREGDDGTDY